MSPKMFPTGFDWARLPSFSSALKTRSIRINGHLMGLALLIESLSYVEGSVPAAIWFTSHIAPPPHHRSSSFGKFCRAFSPASCAADQFFCKNFMDSAAREYSLIWWNWTLGGKLSGNSSRIIHSRNLLEGKWPNFEIPVMCYYHNLWSSIKLMHKDCCISFIHSRLHTNILRMIYQL